MADLNLVCLSFEECQLLPQIADMLSGILAHPVLKSEAHLPLDKYYNAEREQYNAAAIISDYEQTVTDGKVILLTSADLYVPIFTYVFGLAKLNGRVGIVSAQRLHSKFYGLPDNQELFIERLLKEIIHELGHLLNLRHCNHFKCVMASSNTADELDVKGIHYCSVCLNILSQKQQSL